MPTGTPVYVFRLTNSTGAVVELTNWGARWLSAIVPDRNGEMANVLVSPTDLLSDEFYMGAIVGRFANRIGGARLCIDGQTYELEKNDGQNTNHGGFSGFDRMLWDWEVLDDGVRFTRLSPDGEGGYPGNAHISVEYRWNDDNELSIRYYGTTDRATYLNLTNHAYFNLGGKREKITGHVLRIPSHTMLDTTPQFIPTGKRVKVGGTPFDFTSAKPIGQDLYADHEQLKWNKGYNHCYVLKTEKSPDMVEAARLAKEEEKRRKEEARLERARRIEEEKLNKKKGIKKGDESGQEGVKRADSREGIRTYARGRAYIPGRFGEVTPYADPNDLFRAKAEAAQAAAGSKKKKGRKDGEEQLAAPAQKPVEAPAAETPVEVPAEESQPVVLSAPEENADPVETAAPAQTEEVEVEVEQEEVELPDSDEKEGE